MEPYGPAEQVHKSMVQVSVPFYSQALPAQRRKELLLEMTELTPWNILCSVPWATACVRKPNPSLTSGGSAGPGW